MKLDSLSKLRKQFAKRTITRQEFEFRVCFTIICQSILHSNVTPANDFIATVRDARRRNLFRSLFEHHGPLAWSRAENKFIYDYLRKHEQPDEGRVRFIETDLREKLWPTGYQQARSSSSKPLYDRSIQNSTKNATKINSA